MAAQNDDLTPEFRRGWAAAVAAARAWHLAQAKQCLVQAGRSRFPKNFEREAELHTRAAERVALLAPEDV